MNYFSYIFSIPVLQFRYLSSGMLTEILEYQYIGQRLLLNVTFPF